MSEKKDRLRSIAAWVDEQAKGEGDKQPLLGVYKSALVKFGKVSLRDFLRALKYTKYAKKIQDGTLDVAKRFPESGLKSVKQR